MGGAHNRLHETRQHIWASWATAQGAPYPRHGLSLVLDHRDQHLPPGVEDTVAGLDADDLRRAARASAAVLAHVSDLAAARRGGQLPDGLGRFVTGRL